MSEKTLKSRVVQKHDIEANWLKATNFIPKQGEIIVYDVDENYDYERIKIGDGETAVFDLPFAATVDYNDLENKPCYTTKEDVEQTFVEETTFDFTSDERAVISPFDLELIVGEKYTVVIDGTKYENLVCYDASSAYTYGRIGSTDTNYTDYPFYIQLSEWGGFYLEIYVAESLQGTTHNIAIYHVAPQVVLLDTKYTANKPGLLGEGKKAEIFNDLDNNTATGEYSHAEGQETAASGDMGSHAEGYRTTANGWATHAEGRSTTAYGAESHAEGYSYNKVNDKIDDLSVAAANDIYDAWKNAKFTLAYGGGSHVEGCNSLALGSYSHVEGNSCVAYENYGHAEGGQTVAKGVGSHAEGVGTIAASHYSHAQGKYNIEDTADEFAHVVGNGTSDTDRKNAHTLDWDGNAWFAGDVTVGEDAKKLATEESVTAVSALVGDTVVSTQISDAIEGLPQSDWNQNDETAKDYVKNRPCYVAPGANTTLLEETTVVASDFQLDTGNNLYSTTALSVILKDGSTYKVIYDGVEYEAVPYLDGSFVCIGAPTVGETYDFTDYPFYISYFASWNTTYTYVNDTTITGHTFEIIDITPTVVQLDEKYISYKPGLNVEGKTFTIDGTEVVAAVGAEIFNDYENNIASASYSHAEGSETTSTGNASHAEGINTVASGMGSHAEGYKTTASSGYAHAEGHSTVASGFNSHAEGGGSVASGDYSHAEGVRTLASSEYQHVQGKYNVEDTTDTYAHIVGNGTAEDARSNAHTLDWNGNAWFAGDIKIGGTSQNDTTAKTLATTDQIPTSASDIGAASESDLTTLSNLVGDTSVSDQISTAISTSIPSGAKFTDTTYSLVEDDTIETTEANPVDISSTTRKTTREIILRDSSLKTSIVEVTDTNTTYGNATSTASGLMSIDDKNKLDGIESGANKTVVDSTLSSTSTNPVQNKVVNTAISNAKKYTDEEITEWVGDKTVAAQIAEAVATKSAVQIITWEAND